MKKFFTATALVLFYFSLFAQTSDTINIQRDSENNITFASFKKASNERKLSRGDDFLKNFFNAKATDEFRLEKSKKDDLGMDHLKFQQFYRGMKVEGAVYMLHGKSDGIETMNGKFDRITLKEGQPRIAESSALDAALQFVGAKKYSWEDSEAEKFIKANSGDDQATYFPKGELVIIKSRIPGKAEWRIAWRFQISALDPRSIQIIWVDAVTAEFLNRESLICNTNASGTAATRYSGTRNITGDSFTGGFRLREIRNGVDIQTLNLMNNNWPGASTDFVDDDNNWTDAEHNNQAQDHAALDAHWGSEVVLDYWRTVHNRNSIDGNGLRIRNNVHYKLFEDNAGWISGDNVMVYGDGYVFDPLTSLDVCAHEFGHGIDQFESNLSYQSESGAIDEGLADIWGAVIEYWAAPEKNHWLIGEELGGPGALRSMSNPNSTLQPDTYGGSILV